MLAEADKEYVTDLLITWVAPLEKPREALSRPFVGTDLPQDLGQGTPRELVNEALRLCLMDGWNHDPPWLVLLLSLLSNDRSINAKLADIVDRVRIKPPPGPNPLDATILANGIPFVNRTMLRGRLRRLATPATNLQPILVVNGSSKSGKSYSSEYIEHFSYNHPASTITTYRLPFRAEMALQIGARQVARDLVGMMGRPIDTLPPADTNAKLHARNLAMWVLNQAVQSPMQHWFILDNFRGDKLPQDTRDFLIALSELITTGVFARQCRLILTGFDRAILSVDPGRVDEERIATCPPAEIESCIREIAKRASPAVIGPERLFPFVANLPNGDARMREVNIRLRALILAVDQVGEILRQLPETASFEQVLLTVIDDLPSGGACLPELQSRLEKLRESAAEV